MANTHVSCPTCGARQLKPDARFCHHCGATLPTAPVGAPAATGPAANPRGPRWFWPAFAALVIMALAFGALVVLFQRGVVPDDPDAIIAWSRSGVEDLVSGVRQVVERSPGSISPEPKRSPTAELALAISSETLQPTSTPPSAPVPTATAPATLTPMPSPSFTPLPPATSLPTSTSLPTFTPAPTPTPGCALQVGGRFQSYWQAHREALGCPLNRASTTDAATQAFERGRMIWRANNDMIYVLNNAGNWAVFKDIYVEGAPEPGGYAPPQGLQAPVRGFGAIWRQRLGGPGSRIGWATEPERATKIEAQDFERGVIINLEGTVVLLAENGTRWILP